MSGLAKSLARSPGAIVFFSQLSYQNASPLCPTGYIQILIIKCLIN